MEARSYPLRIPKNILELALFRTKEEHIDKATAIRQLLYLGAQQEKSRNTAVELTL